MQLPSARLIGLGLVAVLSVAVAGCSESPDVAPLAQITSNGETEPAKNGIDQLPPEKVLEKVIKNLEDAGTYRVSGVTSAGSAIDISFKTGKGSVGTVTTDAKVDLVASDGVVYITSEPKTLAKIVDADIEDTIAGKWLLIPSGADSRYRIFVEGQDFAEAVLGSQVEGELTAVQEVDGQEAIGLVFVENGGTLWISATGKALPLRLEEKGASAGSGVLTFSDFGKKVKLPVPDKDDVVDPSKLPSDEESDKESDG